jgi:hypothetical protein
MHCGKTGLLDHLIGAAQERQRNGQSECPGDLEVENEFDFRDLLDRQVGWLRALEYSAGVNACQTVGFVKIASITH